MQVSHSRIETFKKCPYQYKLKYIDNLDTLPTDDPTSPLILGHALHTGIEKDVKEAVNEYYNAYPVITDKHVDEALKLEYWIPKVKDMLPANGLHEVNIFDSDYIGFIDYLAPVEKQLKYNYKDNYETGYEWELDINDAMDNTEYYDLYDFKYSNNVRNYVDSEQLHLYKYYFEKLNPTKRIRNMYFMFIPKTQIRIKYKNKTNPKDETIQEFRKRIFEDMETKQIELLKIDYDPNKVIEFLTNTKHAIEANEFPKQESRLCDWCNFKEFCQDGIDYDLVQRKRR